MENRFQTTPNYNKFILTTPYYAISFLPTANKCLNPNIYIFAGKDQYLLGVAQEGFPKMSNHIISNKGRPKNQGSR